MIAASLISLAPPAFSPTIYKLGITKEPLSPIAKLLLRLKLETLAVIESLVTSKTFIYFLSSGTIL
jgi:hypothetical protein